jgi:hypothetical protein
MKYLGGATALVLRRKDQGGAMNNFYAGEATVVAGSSVANTSGRPSGYTHPVSWSLPIKGGGMAAFTTITGSGTISEASLAMGRALTSDLVGSGDITEANMTLIVSFLAELSGDGSLSASLRGAVSLASDLAGSGDLSAALGLIAFMSAAISGSGDIIADLKGKLSMSADISVTGGTLTASSISEAVWSALASANDAAGTMGEKLNDAGSAGNPWAALLASNNDPDTFGKIIQDIQNLVDELHRLQGLNAAEPMTVTPTSRTAGDINLEITGDGITTTTVTRT